MYVVYSLRMLCLHYYFIYAWAQDKTEKLPVTNLKQYNRKIKKTTTVNTSDLNLA